METDIKSPLNRIVEPRTCKFGVPQLEPAPAKQIVTLEINAEILHSLTLQPLERKGVTKLKLLETQEGAVAHPPSAHC